MGWVEKKVRELVPDYADRMTSGEISELVNKAIRETIKRCAEVADVLQGPPPPSMLSASAAIRKLGEP